MQFSVRAKNSGKRIQVKDRIGGGEVFNQFLDPNVSAIVTVGSNDGSTGDIDINAQMRDDSVWVSVQTDYLVKAGDVVDVDDV